MVSSFLSRVFGFGTVMTEDDLERVNETRQGNQYMDEDAENAINRGSVDKPKLTKSPFIMIFEYGTSSKGYWNYDRMVLKLEDCTDCLKVLHPYYEFIFYSIIYMEMTAGKIMV